MLLAFKALVLVAAIAAGIAVGAATGGGGRSAPAAAVRCDRFSAPTGRDRARGSLAHPFRSVRRLVGALRPGQTGCLRQGVYRGSVTVRRGGRRGASVTLRVRPGEHARIVGRLWVDADHVTVAGLRLDERNRTRLPSPNVTARDDRFVGNDVTNHHTAICFSLGFPGYGRARDTLIAHNRIHDCGRLPARNHDHGIYIVLATGATIRDNVIADNADRGIQLYPDAQRTRIIGNLIIRNGEGIIFSGADGVAANDTLVEGNVIADSRVRENVESYYPPGNPIGRRNVVRRNCLRGGETHRTGGVQSPHPGFRAYLDVVLPDDASVSQLRERCRGFAERHG